MNNCLYNCSPEGLTMILLMAALLILGVLVGAAAHTPLPVLLPAAGAIALWLLAFTIRERARER
ncbi:hypothetical protein [Streptomyces sp. ISL-11]|uniref:hypothetical protein n=1 Tax=Streptomyces sp. ISL-11 TaxID=2819174 RepID=UPI001BE98772|nr:hypothetical protein [Streptomyces sp. ISL-11]MBT2384668.1 hypothetical protein [Streptomyces sp. ISL-11]